MNNLYRMDGWVKSVLGQAIAGAIVYVCNQPADVAWVPPIPIASIYSDNAGLVPISYCVTDGFGHYDFYALSGFYTIVVVTGGRIQQVYLDQTVGIPGTVPGTGTVTNTQGPLIAGALIIGNGGSDIHTGPFFSGIATQYLAGTGVFSTPPFPPTMTNLAGGLVPTPPNLATKYLDGTGHFSVPAGGGSSYAAMDIVGFSATPTFNATNYTAFQITLTSNVTSSTFTNGTAGQIYVWKIIQDGTGGWTFTWPTNVIGGTEIFGSGLLPNEVIVQALFFDGTNAYPVGSATFTP